MTRNIKELAAGLLFVAMGLFFAGDALLHLKIGRALSMGPGYFPLMLGGILVLLGGAIALAGLRDMAEPIGPVPWRGLGLVLGSIVFFGITVRGLGLAPALLISILMTARADGHMGWTEAIIVSVLLSLFCILVFVTGLGLPYPIVGHWIGG